MASKKLSLDFLGRAIADGKTPENLVDMFREDGITSVRKLNYAIRSLYKYQGCADKKIKKLVANRKKAVLAAPQNATEGGKAAIEGNPKKAKVPCGDVKVSVAESPASEVVKPAMRVPENPARVSKIVDDVTKKFLRLAAKNGCVVKEEYILDFYEEILKLPMDKVYIPKLVLNSLRSQVNGKRFGPEILERVEFLEKNAQVLLRAPDDIIIINSNASQNNIIFARFLFYARRITGNPHLVALTKSRQVMELIAEYEERQAKKN